MKKVCMFFAALCAVCSALAAQSPYYQGQGGKNLGGIRVSDIVPQGEKLSGDEALLLPSIQSMLRDNFIKYAGLRVAAPQDREFIAVYTLTGTITKNSAGWYFVELIVTDTTDGTIKASSGVLPCSLAGMQVFQVIMDASKTLISGMGVTLTQAGEDDIRAKKEEFLRMANANSPGERVKPGSVYEPVGLDPKLVENARLLAKMQEQNYEVPKIDIELPAITTPVITVLSFSAPENKMVTTGNIGETGRAKQKILDDETEAAKARQKAGNDAIKKMQDAFLDQFRAQSDAVKNQRDALLKQRAVLQDYQKNLLEKQRKTITQARDTENYFDAFFQEHPPFEIIYDPDAKETGTQDGIKRTMDLQFRITAVGTQTMEVIPPVFADITNGLETIARGLQDINAEFDKIEALITQVEAAGNQALAQLVNDYAAQIAKVTAAEREYAAYLERREREVQLTGFKQLGLVYAVKPDEDYAKRLATGQYAVTPSGYAAAKDKTLGDTWSRTKWTKDETRTFAITARLLNASGRTIGTTSATLSNRILAVAYTQPQSAYAVCVFDDVRVDDIIDPLTVVIQSVNDRNVTAASNAYIKISPLEADGYTKDGYNIDGYDKHGYDMLGYNKAGRDRKGRLGALQQELNRIAAEERKFRSKQFAEERLGSEIFAGGGQVGEDRGFGIVGADFIFRLGKPGRGFFFPLGLIAEGAFFAGKDILGGNVGGGLRLALDPEGFPLRCKDISVTGGVSFMKDDAASLVPYLRAGGSFGVLTGAFIWFYTDSDPRIIGAYFGVKFLLGAKLN